jgi:molybdopterin molybdotransferase
MARISELLAKYGGTACIGFDFPFGYPAGSGLGGGRTAAANIALYLTSDELDKNNRFDVASRLNKEISGKVGPFWGCPSTAETVHLTAKKPAFSFEDFTEWREVEWFLREEKKEHSISSVWKLYTTGSVGSQSLTGLKELNDLACQPDLAHRVKFWPFETHWEKDLDGIILTEIWPSLNSHASYDHPIKDARQVLACRDWLVERIAAGNAREAFSAPKWLSPAKERKCRIEEGWILGVR